MLAAVSLTAAARLPTPFVSSGQRRRPNAQLQPSATCKRAAGGETDAQPLPPSAPPPSEQRLPSRRGVLRLYSFGQLAVLADLLAGDSSDGSTDGRTIVNSILGAYGLPTLRASPGYRYFDDLDLPVTFEYPKAWVRRKNSLRPGIIISDFSTADKVSLEVFPEPRGGGAATLAEAAVLKLINPAVEIGGDARLELPPASRIKTEQREVDGKLYTYIAFPSETVTRSGYQVRRKNLAVVAARRGTAYVLGCSARSDQYTKEKEATFQQIVDSYRLL
ncbi:hypothetical protein ABPG75_004007 [Micractinium tetrahymenae]